MKTASIVFLIISIVADVFSFIIYFATGGAIYYVAYLTTIVVIFSLVSIAICSVGLYCLKNDTRNVALGVLLIIFGSLLGGIFYLVWDPNGNSYSTSTTNYSNNGYQSSDFSSSTNESKTGSVEARLERLKKLLDDGVINQEEYEEKKKDIIKDL